MALSGAPSSAYLCGRNGGAVVSRKGAKGAKIAKREMEKMRVHIPSPLRSYTSDQPWVEAKGRTIAELLNRLDQQYPGVRFRMINEQDVIREHIKIFINQTQISDLNAPLQESDTIHIIAALSGG